MPDRVVGKLGRLPAQMPVGVELLPHYHAGHRLPAPPPAVAPPGFESWGMLGNDRYGDCGVAGLIHACEADATVAQESEQWPDAQSVIDYYLAYTGGADTGVVLSQFLGYVRRQPQGILGHTVSAFAPIAVGDLSTLRSAIALYDAAYTGIAVTAPMQESFQAGRAWTTDDLSSPPIGGHCIPLVGYDDSYVYAVTWGAIQPITWPCWHAIASEAWAVITGELVARHGDGRGTDLAALQADLALAGL